MYAFEIPGQRFSLPAGADVERCRFVSANANSAGITATNATQVIGVSMNKVAADQVLEIADGIVVVEAAGAITAGAAVYSAADGRATATEGTGNVAGIALTSASAAGELITVKM